MENKQTMQSLENMIKKQNETQRVLKNGLQEEKLKQAKSLKQLEENFNKIIEKDNVTISSLQQENLKL
jgi:NCAIR mutase (PurE)-related protein